jgi:branched-chain amino acid transport system substrate-binding protein
MDKNLMKTSVGILLALLLFTSPALAQEKGSIKIGFLSPFTGSFAQIGKDMADGANLYLDKIGYKMAGRKVELVVEDDEGLPAVTLTKAKKLVEMNKVNFLIGPLLASSGYALAPYVDQKQVPTIYAGSASDDLTQRKRAKWLVRVSLTDSQIAHPMGDYAYKVLGYRKVVTISMDYAFGWEYVGGFQKVFEDCGGKVLQKIWIPLNAQDFGPYLAQIRKDADAIVATFIGNPAMLFLKQSKEFGIKEKIPIIGAGTVTDESILPSMGDEALDVVTSLLYTATLPNPINQEFVKTYRNKFGKVPSYYSVMDYSAMQWVEQAVNSLKGDISDKNKVFKALQTVSLKETPRGPLKLDAYNNVIQDIFIRKVERVGGELQNKVIHTYPAVSQFWTFKPDDYLKEPVYSRDYPPIKP